MIAVSTVVSALAAVSIAVLTFFLVRATNKYVQETTTYVRLAQEQLNLLRAQLAAPLLLDAVSLRTTPPQLLVRCRHTGNPSSLPALIKAIRLELWALDGNGSPELTDEQRHDEVLKPGRTWARWIQGRVTAKLVILPAPSLLGFLFRHGPGHQVSGRLTVALSFLRAGQAELEEVVHEYEVHSRVLGPPRLSPL